MIIMGVDVGERPTDPDLLSAWKLTWYPLLYGASMKKINKLLNEKEKEG